MFYSRIENQELVFISDSEGLGPSPVEPHDEHRHVILRIVVQRVFDQHVASFLGIVHIPHEVHRFLVLEHVPEPIARENQELVVIFEFDRSRIRRSNNEFLHRRVAQTACDGQHAVDTVI